MEFKIVMCMRDKRGENKQKSESKITSTKIEIFN
jgi:hypothetical protein